MISNKEIGERIKNLRESKKKSQLYVQIKLGISTSSISRLENGNSKTLDLHLLYKIAELFDVTLSFLISDDPSINSSNTKDPIIGELIRLLRSEPDFFKKKVLDITKILKEQ